jgi:hypothetical protein
MIRVSIGSVGLGSLGVSDTPVICIYFDIVYTGSHSQERWKTKWLK